MSLLVIGLSHRTAPIEMRERFAFPDSAIPAVLTGLRQSGLAQEAVILSTCNRVELYAAATSDSGTCAALRKFFLEARACADALHEQIYTLSEPQSLEHLFK